MPGENDNIEKSLIDINITLNKINSNIEKMIGVEQSVDDDRQNIIENNSQGTCPNCGSLNVLLTGKDPQIFYKCSSCEAIWINNLDDWN